MRCVIKTGDDVDCGFYCPDRQEYSCDAVRETWNFYPDTEFDEEFDEFVDACGLDCCTTRAFVEFYDTEERQQARAQCCIISVRITKTV